MFVHGCSFSIFVALMVMMWPQGHCSMELDEKFNRLIDSEWQCETICVGSGGQAKFIPEYKICKCWLEKRIDDVDLQLMLKNARTMGLKLITVEPIESRQSNNIHKRQIPSLTDKAKSPMAAKLEEYKLKMQKPAWKKQNLNEKLKPKKPFFPKADLKLSENISTNINKLKARLAENKANRDNKMMKLPMLKSRHLGDGDAEQPLVRLSNKNWKLKQEMKSLAVSNREAPKTEEAHVENPNK